MCKIKLLALRKWTDDDISKMTNFIGTYFHLLNQAEIDEIISINSERDRISSYERPKVDSMFCHKKSI